MSFTFISDSIENGFENEVRYSEEIFVVLYRNMSKIAPTGNSLDKDFSIWSEAMKTERESADRHVILAFDGETLAGYFIYWVTGGEFYMNEIQFRDEYKGSGLFGELYMYVIPTLPEDTKTVRAIASKQNLKSQALLRHLGLDIVGENKNGRSYIFLGDFAHLRKKYKK